MSSHRAAVLTDQPYTDPNPLPSSVPHVDELGTTSAPLKSASFFIGQHCKAVNGQHTLTKWFAFMLTMTQRTLCYARARTGTLNIVSKRAEKLRDARPSCRSPCSEMELTGSISKMRESCLAEFDAHWQCLEKNNQVSDFLSDHGQQIELTSSISKRVESLNVH
jgi:hypothetical protein